MSIATEQVEIDVAAAPRSSVSWTGVIAGALAAAAISLILMVLGAGFGLSIISPWSAGSVATAAVGSVIWLVVVQWIASGLGGYLAGRLRNHAADPVDERFFRDTVSGFLAWALATLVVAGLLASVVSAIVGTGTQATATVAAGAASAAGSAAQGAASNPANPLAYYVDTLYRPANPAAPATATATPAPTAGTAAPATPTPAVAGTMPAPTAGGTSTSGGDLTAVDAETTRIFTNGLMQSQFPQADEDYLASVVAARTGVSADQAKQRVNDAVTALEKAKTDAQTAADNARKAAAHLALYTFLSLIVGAFIAATAAALGGSHRDELLGTVVR